MINSSNQRFTTGYRAVLTGVFVGIADALISLVYNIVYRSGGADFPQALINVSYLIFGTVFLFFIIGVIFMSLQLFTKKADLLFILLFAALTIIFFTAAANGHFADSPVENIRYRVFMMPWFKSSLSITIAELCQISISCLSNTCRIVK
jgi:hypothetical protein